MTREVINNAYVIAFTMTAQFVMILMFMLCKKGALNRTWPTWTCQNLSRKAFTTFMSLAVNGATVRFGES
jgi:hypothetical protein